MFPAGNGGMIELLYTQVNMDITFRFLLQIINLLIQRITSKLFQTYAPTTLAPARDFWTLRYTTNLENGSLVVRMYLNIKLDI